MTRLSAEEIKDFKVPIEVFKQNCSAIRKSSDFAKERILRALGVDTQAPDSKIDFETFLHLQYVLSIKCQDVETKR